MTTTATKLNLTPLHDRVIVKRLDAEARTAGGIILPDSAKEKPKQGTVISVGPGKRDKDGKRVEPQVKAKDRVLFTSYAGTEVKIDGEEYLIMSEEEILAVIK